MNTAEKYKLLWIDLMLSEGDCAPALARVGSAPWESLWDTGWFCLVAVVYDQHPGGGG